MAYPVVHVSLPPGFVYLSFHAISMTLRCCPQDVLGSLVLSFPFTTPVISAGAHTKAVELELQPQFLKITGNLAYADLYFPSATQFDMVISRIHSDVLQVRFPCYLCCPPGKYPVLVATQDKYGRESLFSAV